MVGDQPDARSHCGPARKRNPGKHCDAGGRLQQASQDPEERGLPSSVGAEQRKAFALSERERDAGDGASGPEIPAEAGDLQQLLRETGLTDVRVSVGSRRTGDPFTVLVASGTKKPRARH